MKAGWWKGVAFCLIFMMGFCASAMAETAGQVIMLPADLKVIGEEAFADASAITHVVVQEGTLEIGPRAFAGSSIQSIALPESLQLIADDAFDGVAGLSASGAAGSYAQEYCEEHGIPFSTYVQAAYPESAHPYEPGVEQTWRWQGSEQTRSLKVTFSENTELAEGYDAIDLYDQYGNWIYRYYDTELQGKTCVISGNAFSIRLISYSETTAYGFDIVSIEEDLVNQPVTISGVAAETKMEDGWTEMTWTVGAEGTYLPFSYRYYVYKDGSRQTTVDSDSNVFSYKVQNSVDYGSYSMSVRVTDAQNNALSYNDKQYIEVEEIPLAVQYVTPATASISAGNTITWSTAAQSTGSELTFTYIVSKDGAEVLRQSEQNQIDVPVSFSYAALESGLYTLTVEVSKWDGKTASLTSAPVEVTDYVVLPETDFTYTLLSETEAEITGYTGTSGAVVIPETIAGASVASIGAEAFRGNAGVNVVILPDTVTAIGNSAFCECANLQKVDLGQGVIQIDHYAFQQCPSISSIDLPASVTSMGYSVFSGCTGLTYVGYPVNLTSAGEQIFSGCSSLKTIEVPNGVTDLPAYVFSGADCLEKVTLPETLLFVGVKAFANCTSLQEASLPDSVEQICSEAFLNCTSLASFHYPLAWTNWADGNGSDLYVTTNVLGGCPLITSIEIPEGVTHIPEGAFESCEYIQTVSLPSTLVSIDHRAFRECTAITEMVFPDGLLSVGGRAFEGCTNLAEAVLPDSVETILQGAFLNCSALTSFHYPQNWTMAYKEIYDSGWGYDYSWGQILAGCPLITEIDIPEGVTEIPDYAFSRCESIEDVHFPDSLTAVGYCAFEACTALIEADLPDSVERIEGYAFSGCTALELFHYPLSWRTSETGFDWEGSPLNGCPLITVLEVPEGVTLIPDKAWRDSDYLEEIILPSTLVEIGEKSFYNCQQLSKIYIPSSVQLIGKDAFKNCPNLYLSCEWGSEAQKYAEDNMLNYNYLTLNGGAYPEGTLYQGDDFSFRGYLHSKQTITHLVAGIYDSDGTTMVQGAAVTPDATSVRLSTAIGDMIDLSALELGTYRFQLKATTGGVQTTVVDSMFIITLPPTRIKTEGMTSPEGILTVGEDFTVECMLSSNKLMTSVVITIVDEDDGLEKCYYGAAPNAFTFDISAANDNLDFASLPAGSYVYRISVIADSETTVVAESRFTLYTEDENSQRAQKLDESLSGSSSAVNNNLLYESMILANAAYKETRAKSNLNSLGFDHIEQYSIMSGAHTIGHYFGWKDIQNADGTTTRVYAVICRGTTSEKYDPEKKEWISNFTFISDTDYHYGFYEATKEVMNNFNAYVAEHKPEDSEATDCKVWITGHSRGAAVANLLGGVLFPDAGFDRSNTYVYTFSCPLVSTGSTEGGYNIFNYNIGGDIVPRVPLASWGYSRFGQTTTLKNSSYAFGENLIENDAMDNVEEKLSEALSLETLQRETVQFLTETAALGPSVIMAKIAGLHHELMCEIVVGNAFDALELTSIYPTHKPGTYVQWISSITH